MTALHVREAVTDADWAAVRSVREVVFVREQACPPEEEWDGYDAPEVRGRSVHHLLGTVDGETAACARWRPVETDSGVAAKLERFAVLAPFRGRGLGRDLVAAALADARAAGFVRFVLHAQVHLAAFYASFGFEPVGERFWDVGIEHVKMTLEDPDPP